MSPFIINVKLNAHDNAASVVRLLDDVSVGRFLDDQKRTECHRLRDVLSGLLQSLPRQRHQTSDGQIRHTYYDPLYSICQGHR